MSIDYAAMSDRELKEYFLAHRDDHLAFQAYMDRRGTRPAKTIIAPDDPAWEEKVIAAIQEKLNAQ